MVFGEEICFQIKDSARNQDISELFLRYIGMDNIGIKMKGTFLKLWSKRQNRVIGPPLFNEGHIYQVIDFDYDFGKLWLRKKLISRGRFEGIYLKS